MAEIRKAIFVPAKVHAAIKKAATKNNRTIVGELSEKFNIK